MQQARVHRLRQAGQRSGRGRRGAVLRAADTVNGQVDGPAAGESQPAEQRGPLPGRGSEVGDHQVRVQPAGQAEGRTGPGGLVHLPPGNPEQVRHAAAVVGVGVDGQGGQHGVASVAPDRGSSSSGAGRQMVSSIQPASRAGAP